MSENLALLLGEPKIDTHCHILDPARFAYSPEAKYQPIGQEVGTALQMEQVFATFGVSHALIVQPNSGYAGDNRCLLAALSASAGRHKGVAVVPADISRDDLAVLKAQGVVGVAYNLTVNGLEVYLDTESLLEKLVDLDMFLQLQFEDQQLVGLLPLLNASPVKLLIDHCGRPSIADGLNQPAFKSLLDLGGTGRAAVKLSGYQKFSRMQAPYEDAWPFVQALVEAYSLDRCLWASDWPYLRAPERLDYGPLLALAGQLFPDPDQRRKLFWETPRRLFGFSG
ncbi:MAG: amidohydrolase family protein [Rhodospirillales bacterium]|nr:amidohydrolase family protein [Rhodospirillales bacterium]